ncbi:MAG TPA: o-succinylbenzoate synthase [Acidimicrobiales bacterium]|nr:o-succinylbenzoate synthase [Acidimicrobiales bacterium]
MRLAAVELRRLRLPLRAGGWREVVLVRVETPDGDGWGECAALGEPSYTAEYAAGAQAVLQEWLAPAVLAAGDLDAAGVGPALAGVRGHRMAKAALEMAVLDAELRAAGVPLAARLGATRTEVEAGVVLERAASVGALLDAVAAAVDEGWRRVKLKIGPGWDVEPVRTVRERWPDLTLQVDANGAYGPGDLAVLEALDAFALAMVEQPLAASDLLASATVARRLRTPVCLDEAVTSAAAAEAALALGACSVVNVKPGRVGGYLEAVRVHDTCRAAGVPVWCGGMWETGLARSANLALAALPGFTLPGDLSPPSRYLAADIAAPLRASGGRLAVPTTAGAGAAVDLDSVERATVVVLRVTPE